MDSIGQEIILSNKPLDIFTVGLKSSDLIVLTPLMTLCNPGARICVIIHWICTIVWEEPEKTRWCLLRVFFKFVSTKMSPAVEVCYGLDFRWPPDSRVFRGGTFGRWSGHGGTILIPGLISWWMSPCVDVLLGVEPCWRQSWLGATFDEHILFCFLCFWQP